MRLLEQMRQVSRRVRRRSWMRLQEGYPSQIKVEISTETNAENPDNDDDEGEEDDEEADRKLMRRLKTLSGTRKQLFRYLYTET